MGEPIKPKAAAPVESAAPTAPASVIPLTETPEFKAAVAEAATQAAAFAIAQFASAKPASDESAPSMDAQDLLRGLALAIAEMSHQGDKRDKPVDPKVMAERRAAQERMELLIDEAMALPKGDHRRPKYKVRSVVMLADYKIDPYRRDPATKKAVPVEFRWCLEPNDAMIPLNDLAERIFAEFRASRGNKYGKDGYSKNEVRRTAWFTDGGLLIEGVPPVRREIMLADATSDALDVSPDPSDPNATHVRVLGTSHPPARQYNADNPV